MMDFLTFKSFITPSFLILFYFIGAMVIPLFSWILMVWIQKRYFSKVSLQFKEIIRKETTFFQRFLFMTLLVLSFLAMEIFWRMMFEFMIAYFDMHDALMRLSS